MTVIHLGNRVGRAQVKITRTEVPRPLRIALNWVPSGDLTVPGLMELLGHVDGKISADTIVIEASGSAVGELRAAGIAIKGQFEGRIFGGNAKL